MPRSVVVSVGNLWGAGPGHGLVGFLWGSPGLRWRREHLVHARQRTAMPRLLEPGHLISRHSPSEGISAPGAVIAVPDITARIDQNERRTRIDRLGDGIMTAAARNEPVHDETYLPRQDDAEIIDFLSALRDRGGQPAGARPRLVGPDGHSVELPESVFGVLLQVAGAMKAGLAVTVAPHHLTLSTQEAACLLRISRTTLVRLLEADMVADTERLGLYDTDPAEVAAALKAARQTSRH
jgi:hypothetical protein